MLKFHALHHFWFLLCKLLKDGGLPRLELPGNVDSDLRVSKFSSQGGFLKQPAFDSLPVEIDKHASDVGLKTKETFGCLISEMAWPIFYKCLVEGREFIDYNLCQVLSLFIFLISVICLVRLFSLKLKKKKNHM